MHSFDKVKFNLAISRTSMLTFKLKATSEHTCAAIKIMSTNWNRKKNPRVQNFNSPEKTEEKSIHH